MTAINSNIIANASSPRSAGEEQSHDDGIISSSQSEMISSFQSCESDVIVLDSSTDILISENIEIEVNFNLFS